MRPIIYNDINDSNYYLTIGKIKLYFSSEFNKTRFKNTYENYIKQETLRVKNKYKVNIMANYYFLISYYKKIEKRGFKLINNVTNTSINENLTFICEL